MNKLYFVFYQTRVRLEPGSGSSLKTSSSLFNPGFELDSSQNLDWPTRAADSEVLLNRVECEEEDLPMGPLPQTSGCG